MAYLFSTTVQSQSQSQSLSVILYIPGFSPSIHLSNLLSQGTKARGGQAGVGYKGSTESGSAPTV